jgi:hypothetical protein
MSDTVTRIKCGNCHQYHDTVGMVKRCHFRPPHQTKPCLNLDPHPLHYSAELNWTCPGIDAPAAVAQSGLGSMTRPKRDWRSEPVTDKQKDKLKRMGINPSFPNNKGEASDLIGGVTKAPQEAKIVSVNDAPNRRTTKIPLEMIHAIPDGYYASRQDSTRPLTFFRISRPKRGDFKGAIKVQTQHGPDLKLALTIYPGDRVYWSNMAVEDDLLLVVVDPNGTGIAYAEELQRCMRCNTELTDERSRWFGIGPECEKHWPHIIDLVTDRKGRFVPGWEQQT